MMEQVYAKPNGSIHEEPAPVHFEEMRVTQSPELGKLAEALAKAQLKFTAITKDSTNPAFKRGDKVSKYADFASVLRGTQHALAEEGLVVFQSPNVVNKVLVMTSTLIHSSGQWIRNELTMPAADERGYTAHSIGKAITYARRYSYQCMVGATAEEDDDGNDASGVGSKQAADAVAKAKLEESAKSSDPKTAAIAREGLAKINAADTAKDLEGQLARSLEQQKDEGLFDSYSGVIQSVRQLATSAAKGSRPYRKVAMTIFEDGKPKDIEFSAFDNFKMSDTTCFNALDAARPDDTACFILEQQGKYLNLKDIKQIASSHWDARIGVIQR
jgi:hypothetical protein